MGFFSKITDSYKDTLNIGTSTKDQCIAMKEKVKAICPNIADGALYSDAAYGKLANIINDDSTMSFAFRSPTNLMIITNNNLIIIDNKPLNPDADILPLKQITSTSVETGIMTSKLLLTVAGKNITLEKLQRKDAQNLLKEINHYIETFSTTVIQDISPSVDYIEQIEKLSRLKDQGILTQKEFAEKKADILAKI